MRKAYMFSAGLILLSLCTTACGKQEVKGDLKGQPLNGTWIGTGNAIGYDEDYNIETQTLTITEDGHISLDDADQDTDNLDGAIFVESDDSFSIQLSEKPEKLTLPAGWGEMKSEDTITYEQLSDQQMVLTYNDISYFFCKDTLLRSGDISPLYNLGENNIWYSNDGQSSPENTFTFELFDNYAELYSISPNNSKALITSFYYLSNKDDSFHFYTNIRKEKDLPGILSSIPKGKGEVTLQLHCEDETLSVGYNEKNITFYNNVIYGLETDSDSYRLCDKGFHFNFEEKEYRGHFKMNTDKNSLYLYIDDMKDADKLQTICGEVDIDEKHKNWIWYFDKDLSGKTTEKDSDLYRTFSAYNGIKVKYNLKDNQLFMKTGDDSYNTKLFDYVPSSEESTEKETKND
ncbi:MAG: hypothetical protein Q4E53_01735 [Eubacteriales bacterium]|nr:hypothetical protein [Eubacteriales bacterium]